MKTTYQTLFFLSFFFPLITLLPLNAYASGLLLPDRLLRSDLLWLNERGVIRTGLMTWPLSKSEVVRALKHARPIHSSEKMALERVLNRINKEMTITAYARKKMTHKLPEFAGNHYAREGMTITSFSEGENWTLRLNGNIESRKHIENTTRFNLHSSYGAVQIFDQSVSFGQIPKWWGPGQDGSLILSDASRPVTGFSMQRTLTNPPETEFLKWTGPWQYQLSFGQLSQYKSVPEAMLMGARIIFSPANTFDIGFSRVIQWGGKGRPFSWGTFWEAVAGKDNTGTVNEPGNQLAGIDFKIRLEPLTGRPLSFYGQIVGEDEAGYLPSANMFLAGLEGHLNFSNKALSWYLEAYDTRTNFGRKNYSYRHHIYQDGYYHQGFPLGAALGGDAQLLTAGIEWVINDELRWKLRGSHAKVNPTNQKINKAYPEKDTLKSLQIDVNYEANFTYGFNLAAWFTNSKAKSDDIGVGLTLLFSL
ncbi:capsule assembly Wzi family protein [Pantoea ananatis]|uniref:capsule assembly Wzi family protein n=1 Tax=Pantoea ananas TaxID=553 RepID=UPI000E392349|nr:capsule assembly Wzi family protein [Pantoea ananatis]REE79670.1 capsule assembly protein Wzi [Pantoea ananatis]